MKNLILIAASLLFITVSCKHTSNETANPTNMKKSLQDETIYVYHVPTQSLADSLMGQPVEAGNEDWTFFPVQDSLDRYVIGLEEHDLCTNPIFATQVAAMEQIVWFPRVGQ
jgi:hypothetical protein